MPFDINFIRVATKKRIGALNMISREDSMRRPATLFPIVLALGAIILAPRAGAQDAREGPREIEKCQTIDKSGSYRLVNNLKTGPDANCLVITADFVTIDLAGFTITGGAGTSFNVAGIVALPSSGNLVGIAVRNGSISNFANGADLASANSSIAEGLRVSGAGAVSTDGIIANGIVKGNTVIGIFGIGPGHGTGISATGTVTGNYVTGSRGAQIVVGQGSTVIGNTAIGIHSDFGINVDCPSNVTDNTAVNNVVVNLFLHGDGCNNTNNEAP
jgi:hypothetical protein